MSSDITNLPIEVIDLIFGHLTMANDRRRTAQVCKLFNKVIRSQSIRNRNNTLRLGRSLSGESPFRVFKNWETLPFSKLYISVEIWNQFIVKESDFWTLHGHEISEMFLIIDNNFDKEKSLLPILSNYFPNLKKLSIEIRFYHPNINKALLNTLNCSLPIQELYFSSTSPLEMILTVLRCSPHLKKLEINRVKPDFLPKILPWIESVEASCLHFDETPLAKLINLPSKVVFVELTIKVDEIPEMIREFFKRPRVIETLILKRQAYNLEFNRNEEEGENNPRYIFFTRDQVEVLRGAKSIKNVELSTGVLDFGGSLDLLATLPGVESISLNLTWHRHDQLYPLYWSSPETAKKIHVINHKHDSPGLDYLDGLSSLTTFTVRRPYGYQLNNIFSSEIQHLIRNCPNLKKLQTDKIFANDADLIGTGEEDLLPISSLGKLECLDIFDAPNITSEAFKSAFKFPNLKFFSLRCSYIKPFNQNDAKFFTQNCPNVSELNIRGFQMNEEAFEYLIRNLPYLRKIHIVTKHPNTWMIREEKVNAMKKEFPYINFEDMY